MRCASPGRERFIGIEEARGKLGEIGSEVAEGAEPVVVTKRGRALAVLVGRDEFSRLKEAAAREAREELQTRLAEIRRKVKEAGLPPEAVDEAIAAARRLG